MSFRKLTAVMLVVLISLTPVAVATAEEPVVHQGPPVTVEFDDLNQMVNNLGFVLGGRDANNATGWEACLYPPGPGVNTSEDDWACWQVEYVEAPHSYRFVPRDFVLAVLVAWLTRMFEV